MRVLQALREGVRQLVLFQILHMRIMLNSIFHFTRTHIMLVPLFTLLFGGIFWGYFMLVGKLVAFVYFQPYYGVILSTKLIQLLLLVAIGLSFVSGLTPSISTLYLSKDLEFQFSLPSALPAWLADRAFSILLQSGGMMLLFGSPFLFHFITCSQKGFGIFLLAFLAMVMTCAVPVLITMMGSIALVRIFPVQRIQQVFLILSVITMATLVLFFRYLEPERFIGPGGMELFKGYLDLVQLDGMAWNPGIWAGNFITALSQGEWREASVFFSRLAAIDTALLLFLFIWGSSLYRRSWDRALHALSGDSKPSRRRAGFISRLVGHPVWNQEIKEILVFIRDPSQWAQIFVLIALVFLYLFSVNKLGDSPFGQSPLMLAIGNSGFIAFVALSISSRFVFTSFSMDGYALWILQTVPGGWHRYVRSKFLVFGCPAFVFALLLQIGTIKVLGLNAQEGLYLLIATIWDCLFLVSLSTLFGMVFMNPGIDNPLKLIISPAGILLMGTGLFFSLLHTLIRYSGQNDLFNFYTRRFGFPDLRNGKELIWSLGLCLIELFILFYLNFRAMKTLQTRAN